MLGTLFSALREEKEQDNAKTRRRFDRRSCDKCVTLINNKIYPVENWSVGGLMINGDSRPFGIDNEIDVTLKFKLRERVMDVRHRARVIRKTHDKVAFEFLPLTKRVRDRFQNVLDDYVTSRFAESQLN